MRRATAGYGYVLTMLLSALPAVGAEPLPAPPGATEARPLTRQLQMNACYVKEDADRAWQLRIAGRMPLGPGVYVIVYNAAGDVVQRAAVPYGIFPAGKPHVVNIPADGKAQQYVVKLIGQQDNLNGMILPLTDLPHEVYGDNSFSFGGSAETHRRIVAFQAPGSGRPIQFSGYKGDYRILDDAGLIIADSKEKVPLDPKGRNAQPEVKMALTLPPGKTFWLEPYGVYMLGVSEGKLYLTFDPERWFEPELTWTLESRPWWKGLINE